MNDIDYKCDDPEVLREMGRCYKKLLYIANKEGTDPYPCSDSCPTKYFIMLHNQVVNMGIPEALQNQIADLMARVDPDDWIKSQKEILPMEKRSYFSMGMLDARLEKK